MISFDMFVQTINVLQTMLPCYFIQACLELFNTRTKTYLQTKEISIQCSFSLTHVDIRKTLLNHMNILTLDTLPVLAYLYNDHIT